VVEDTLDYLLREMAVPGGAFAASQDADTDGEEGATYVWTADEIRAVLGSEQAALFADAYDVTEAGNWEGTTILRRVRDDVALAARHAIAAEQVAERLADARALLFEARRRRPQPARDDKTLAAWNGLAIAALAEAAVALERPDYAAAATAAAAALWDGLRTAEGRLLRSWKDGRAKHAAVLEDHADLPRSPALCQATSRGAGSWLLSSAELIVERFADPAGGWFDTADHEALVADPRVSGQRAAERRDGRRCALLAALTGDARYRSGPEPGGFCAARRRYRAASWRLVAADLRLSDR
jgi:uncharacterized protein YyaL (SSP411 family)